MTGCSREGHHAKTALIDHDHATGQVHGLLHLDCNGRLHKGSDDGWYANVADYLVRTKA